MTQGEDITYGEAIAKVDDARVRAFGIQDAPVEFLFDWVREALRHGCKLEDVSAASGPRADYITRQGPCE